MKAVPVGCKPTVNAEKQIDLSGLKKRMELILTQKRK